MEIHCRTARLPGRVPGLRFVPHLRDPAVPGAGSARAGGGAGGFPLPIFAYRRLSARGNRGCDWVLARTDTNLAADTGSSGRSVRVRLRGTRARECVRADVPPG
jgi:hypothetical protein